MSVGQELTIKNILTDAVKRGASDLHFSVGNNPILRIDDHLVYLEDQEVVTQDFMQGLVDFLLTKEKKEKLLVNKEIVLAYNFDNNLRFKVNIFYQRGFLSVSLRHIPYQVPTLESLKLNSILSNLVKNKNGLILVSGPFGSGRSTTIAALIEEINRSRKEYIITIEDPIEYIFTNNKSIIEQREVGIDTNSFAEALKYFEEEDGDILFLEEINKSEVIPAVLEIARGSSLVFSAISADSSTNAIARILDMFPAYDQERIRDLLATALRAVICQKIIPKIGGGVAVVQEVLVMNEAVKSMIINGNIAGLNNLIQTSRNEGMVSFNYGLAKLVKSSKITREDALDNTTDRKILESLLR
ncbi:PilT/PilU family type 4a pilus ATPase [Candidatus Falkowbacteria bacterium]|uniref:Type IV pili twitching motility protein PilT n=1 Tax=Candidatus Buchananbacteria bacterium CG10_big_fil_rev_8_21_14_0_10_33_19 TaxID=1974525 RepID=A0A2H0W4G0_9BACT|nr:PilT/PilU family type 4a pilus ATPase [Candidatus Falkowbacteria bacterium]PIS06245.1 MAG: type IV pili twitching motility protein PilT [Candidatus Buchananbacteria bacterium CG10_big_fil_rev_8_21_14_0_10_33_19]